MIIVLKDQNTLDVDVVFITKTTTAKQLKEIIADSKAACGDTDNYDWCDLEGRLPNDVKCYKEWNCEFETIYW